MENAQNEHLRIIPNITINRDGLMRAFDSLSDERIIYIGAPAGCGKTVAVRQWIARGARAHAVISLDEYDNDPMHFCERFCDALRQCQPQNAALNKLITNPSFVNAPAEFTVRAISALTRRKGTALVIDDLHLIRNERVLKLIQIFLKRLPLNFKIVLVSRNNPPPGFSDLWLNGSLARVTTEHFLFSAEEIAMLYRKRGIHITAEQARSVFKFTEGWAIGVNALCLSGGEPTGEIMSYLDGFIRDNIWERWDEATREFMIKTAVASELTPSLCAALTDMEDCEDILRALVRQNAFISVVGGSAYKYHQLFQEYLMRMAVARGEAFVRGQWMRIGHWYLSNNGFYEALDYFIRCESYDDLARVFVQLSGAGYGSLFIDKMIAIAHKPAIERTAERYPSIYATLMWVAYNEGRHNAMVRYADLYYKYLPEIARDKPEERFNIAFAWLVDYRKPLMELIQMAGPALSGPMAEVFKESGVPLGIINQNMPLLHRGTRDFSACAVGDVDANIAQAEAALGRLFGKGSALLAECLLAGIAYEQGRLENAYGHALAANAAIGALPTAEARFFTMMVTVYILDALGEGEQTDNLLGRINRMIEDENAYYLLANYRTLIAHIKLGDGDTEAARIWLLTHETVFNDEPRFHAIYEYFITCRAHIVIGDYDAAIVLLTKLLQMARLYDRPLDKIEARILLAVAYWKKKRGFQRDALQFLEDAIAEAHIYGYTQLFINEGAELAGMTMRLERSMEQRAGATSVPISFVKMLGVRMREGGASGLTSGQIEASVRFTQKQLSVMEMLCGGHSYKDMAEAMGVKLPTLRSHIALIYKKLDVTNAADAIKRIEALGVLKERG